MKKQLWIMAMAIMSIVAVGSPGNAQSGVGSGEGCYQDGSLVMPASCASKCCSGNCGACHVSGFYECGGGIGFPV